MPAHTAHMRRVALSPYRKTEDESADFGVCLHGPISVSRFHKHSVRASSAKRAVIGALAEKFSEQVRARRAGQSW